MPVTPHQIMIGRKLTRLTILQLSRNAGVSPSTLSRVESGRSTQKLTLYVLRKALEDAGAEFLVDGSVTFSSRKPVLDASDRSLAQHPGSNTMPGKGGGMLT